MKAIILCAGDGTRLRPLTQVTPKPLVEIHKERTILEYVLDALPSCIDEVYLIVSPSKTQLFDVFLRTHTFPYTVYTHIQDSETVGTWSALASVKEFILPHETFLVLNGDDIFIKEDLEVFVTLPTPVCGLFTKISNGRYRTCDRDETTHTITSFRSQREEEVGTPVPTFTGMYLLSGEFFNFPPVLLKDEYSIPDTVFQYYGTVGYYTVSSWYQINTLEEYEEVKLKLDPPSVEEKAIEEALGE